MEKNHKRLKKASGKRPKRKGGVKSQKRYNAKSDDSGLSKQNVREPALQYEKPMQSSIPPLNKKLFTVTIGGHEQSYSIDAGYGYFIPSFRKAENLVQVSEYVEKGLSSKDIESIIEYLGFKVPEIAKAAAVSPSTVSRWEPETSIGVPGSMQFFRIDEVIRKGVTLFGGEQEFKSWLDSPNLALGNAVPAKLIISLIGIELVDEALDALHYGNVM